MDMNSTLRGRTDYPALSSDTTMRSEAFDSPQIRRTKEWHDDRRAQRAQLNKSQIAGGTIPVAAAVPSRVRCEVCGVFIEAVYQGNTYVAPSIYFYPVYDERIKLVTKTCFVHNQILIVCEECAGRKRTPSQRSLLANDKLGLAPGFHRKNEKIRVTPGYPKKYQAMPKIEKEKLGLTMDYARVQPTDWVRFPTHTDLKQWLLWQRLLCEYFIFYTRPFLIEISLLLHRKPFLEEETPEANQDVLMPFGSVAGLPLDAATYPEQLPLVAEASIPLAPAAQQFFAEQQRLKQIRPPQRSSQCE